MTEKEQVVAQSIDRIFSILEAAQDQDYIGEPISQLEHALQCAKLALDAGSSNEMIIAALLHDLGHLCSPPSAKTMDEFGIDEHHRYAGEFLKKLGFSETVAQLIEGHVEAKRYLVSKNPKYFEQLSAASRETLKRQGGPMSEDERNKFAEHPLMKEMLRLRVFDDQAKRTDWEVPPLQHYRKIVQEHLSS